MEDHTPFSLCMDNDIVLLSSRKRRCHRVIPSARPPTSSLSVEKRRDPRRKRKLDAILEEGAVYHTTVALAATHISSPLIPTATIQQQEKEEKDTNTTWILPPQKRPCYRPCATFYSQLKDRMVPLVCFGYTLTLENVHEQQAAFHARLRNISTHPLILRISPAGDDDDAGPPRIRSFFAPPATFHLVGANATCRLKEGLDILPMLSLPSSTVIDDMFNVHHIIALNKSSPTTSLHIPNASSVVTPWHFFPLVPTEFAKIYCRTMTACPTILTTFLLHHPSTPPLSPSTSLLSMAIYLLRQHHGKVALAKLAITRIMACGILRSFAKSASSLSPIPNYDIRVDYLVQLRHDPVVRACSMDFLLPKSIYNARPRFYMEKDE